MDDQVYDFIVVGAGPAGCVLASRLAESASHPSVLLLEAGGDNSELSNLPGDERFVVAFKKDSPLNWGYKVQQYGRELDYSRGKGLGGSTAINFCGWVTGPSDDYDHWASIVGDEAFSWQNARRHLQGLTSLDRSVPQDFNATIKPSSSHGKTGPIHLSYGQKWQDSVHDVFSAAVECGFGVNPDVNDGNPLGVGIGSVCISNGQRITSADAFLSSGRSNLKVLTNTHACKIDFEGPRATKVRATNGRSFTAQEEIVLSCGAIDTPKLLQLSGIGPRDLLEHLRIPVVHELPHVGENLQDHCFATAGITIKQDETNAEKQSPSPMGWLRIPAVLVSPEFASLPTHVKKHLQAPTVPSWELVTHTPLFDSIDFQADEQPFSTMAILMNPQSRGVVRIVSADPKVAPHIDPEFLSHPFDRTVLIAAMREMLKFLQAPVWRDRTMRRIGWPEDDSDEAFLKQIKSRLASSWHMCGTVKMGITSDSACVDSNFQVFGVEGLRVVDLSVCPFVPNNHTQSTACVVGAIAAEKIIQAYSLDSRGSRL